MGNPLSFSSARPSSIMCWRSSMMLCCCWRERTWPFVSCVRLCSLSRQSSRGDRWMPSLEWRPLLSSNSVQTKRQQESNKVFPVSPGEGETGRGSTVCKTLRDSGEELLLWKNGRPCLKAQRHQNMTAVASFLFRIPVTSASVERVFSLTAAAWTDRRDRCSAELIGREIQVINDSGYGRKESYTYDKALSEAARPNKKCKVKKNT